MTDEQIFASQKEARKAFHWFADQAVEIQLEILHKKLGYSHKREKTPETLVWCDFVRAIMNSGFTDEARYNMGLSITDEAAKGMTRRRAKKAARYASSKKCGTWLRQNWGKVVEARRAGLSWRDISTFLYTEYGVEVSHSTLLNYHRKFL